MVIFPNNWSTGGWHVAGDLVVLSDFVEVPPIGEGDLELPYSSVHHIHQLEREGNSRFNLELRL